MRIASATLAAIMLFTSTVTREAWATPTSKRCIEAAESGQQLRSSGKLMESRKTLSVCTAPACPAAVRRDCARWIEEIDASQPTISIRLEDEGGREITDGKVVMDAEVTMPASAGRAVAVDPGAHRFVWNRRDGNVEEEVVIREGEHNRAIILRLRGATGSGLVGPRGDGQGDEKPLPPPPPSSRSPAPWIIGGLGVAAIGGGAAFWAIGYGQHSDLGQTCAPAHTCAQADIDGSRTKLIVGDIFVGVGILAVAAAVYLFATQSDPPQRSASH